MAHDRALADRVRRALATRDDITERNMMGVLCFMAGGHMCCGVSGASLMVRVGSEGQERALAMPHVRLLEIGGRQAPGFVVVDMAGIPSDEAFAEWIGRGLDFVATLPPK